MIYEKLYQWQKNLIDKFKDKESYGLFLDMGLGKTPISLAFAEQNDCTKVIIITLNSKAIESENESGSWLDWARQSKIKYNFITKYSKQFFNPLSSELLLLNYESLAVRRSKTDKQIRLKDNIVDFIQSCKGHNVAIIIDESHKTKNLKSVQTDVIAQIKKKLIFTANTVYTYLLTGTPFTTGYIDLYSQLRFLGYDGTKTRFKEDFCEIGNVPGLLGWQQPIVGYKNIDKLFDLIHKYAITIKSEDVIDLPDKIFVNHTTNHSSTFDMFVNEFVYKEQIIQENNNLNRLLKIDANELTCYDDKKKIGNPFFRNIAYPDLKWLADTSGTFWLRARQLSIGFQGNSEDSIWYDRTRLNQLEEFLRNNEDNYVLFYNYTPELLELYDICEKLKYNIDVYCGEVKSLTFYNKYSSLSESKRLSSTKNIILANFASGSTGMNWQNYNKCILFSIPLFKDYEQGIKRIHRLGQKQTTIYYMFYQNNWLDLSMKKALEESRQYNLDMFESDLYRIKQLNISKN